MTETTAAVGIIMGSQSDWETMRHAAETLETLGVPFETRIVSAHRTPRRLYAYAEEARGRGLKVIVAGAGGAAHLPGMTASMTPLPVIGVPVESKSLKGMDSLLSIVQMPAGVPVATVAIGRAGAVNAALLAAAIVALGMSGWPPRSTNGGPIRPPQSPKRQRPNPVIAPGGTIGILGGGQLGRMLAIAAAPLGYRCHIFSPKPGGPAAQVSAAETVGAYDDPSALDAFGAAVDVVTVEFENVPASALERLKTGSRSGRAPARSKLRRTASPKRISCAASGWRRRPMRLSRKTPMPMRRTR